ncbi:MAG TPA: alpha/beta fold hydrolase [Pseudomonadota bacterium]|nr:alpha/beta fold hydrolase [Pseudomonadota bacterium]
MRRIRGLMALLHDGVDLTADLLREGMESSARTVKLVNRTVRVVTDVGLDLVERVAGQQADAAHAADPALPPAVAMRSDVMKTSRWASDAALGLVNAVVGDHLHRHGNGLDLGMSFRIGDCYVPLDRKIPEQVLPQPSPKVALFIHGLATTEWSFCLGAETYYGEPGVSFGSLLHRDLGYTPVWLRYNSGRHVSENGRLLAAELERFLAAYPIPVEELVLVGHSMGGLVARSACHYASSESKTWPSLVSHVFCLGSPHRGAPLEKFGNLLTRVLGAIDLPGTRIPARILAGRSAGIKDLRHGALVDEDWIGRDPDALLQDGQREVPLLPSVSYHFVSATVTTDPDHPLGRIIGDLLVRVPSSSGPVTHSETFAIETRHFGGVLHHQLQNHPAVYEVLRSGCALPIHLRREHW